MSERLYDFIHPDHRLVSAIEGTLTMTDGTVRDFVITSNGYHQWGDTSERLAETVGIMSEMEEAAGQFIADYYSKPTPTQVVTEDDLREEQSHDGHDD